MKTDVNPLITNFMVPQMPEVVPENGFKMIYDPRTHITMLMGGGNSRGTRSFDGYKATRKRLSGCCYSTDNDAERWTDD